MSIIDDVSAALTAAIDGLSVEVLGDEAQTGLFTVTAQDPPLPTLDTATLPNAYVLSGEASDEPAGDDGSESIETRTYRVQVATGNFGEDEPNHRERVIRALLPSVKLALRVATKSSLSEVVGVFTARVTGDSGPVILAEYGGNYVGFEIRLSVEELIDP